MAMEAVGLHPFSESLNQVELFDYLSYGRMEHIEDTHLAQTTRIALRQQLENQENVETVLRFILESNPHEDLTSASWLEAAFGLHGPSGVQILLAAVLQIHDSGRRHHALRQIARYGNDAQLGELVRRVASATAGGLREQLLALAPLSKAMPNVAATTASYWMSGARASPQN